MEQEKVNIAGQEISVTNIDIDEDGQVCFDDLVSDPVKEKATQGQVSPQALSDGALSDGAICWIINKIYTESKPLPTIEEAEKHFLFLANALLKAKERQAVNK